jgi:hypothetical protein
MLRHSCGNVRFESEAFKVRDDQIDTSIVVNLVVTLGRVLSLLTRAFTFVEALVCP